VVAQKAEGRCHRSRLIKTYLFGFRRGRRLAVFLFRVGSFMNVRYWQCAPKARIISGRVGGSHTRRNVHQFPASI
jgi:hypothetical protein